jgi:4-amino-4-deoxy-L-arabinose transferase-like glycosyltransferase
VNTRIGSGQPAADWDAPGWAPLVDHGPYPLQAARSIRRWLWFTAAVGGFLAVTAFTLAHDDPAPGLSLRGLLTIALAAAVVVLLTVHRSAGPRLLARVLAEYTVVFVLAVLVATTGLPLDPPPAAGGQASAAIDHRPPLVQTIDTCRDRLVGAGAWLAELWRRADPEASHRRRPPSTTRPSSNDGQAMPHSPALSPSTRRPL